MRQGLHEALLYSAGLGAWQLHIEGCLPRMTCRAYAGLTSYGSQFCMTNALRYARAAPALAMSYISIVLTIIYGFYIFDEVRARSPCTAHPRPEMHRRRTKSSSCKTPHRSLCWPLSSTWSG